MKKVLSFQIRCTADYASFLVSRMPKLGYPYSASWCANPFDQELKTIFHFNYSNNY